MLAIPKINIDYNCEFKDPSRDNMTTSTFVQSTHQEEPALGLVEVFPNLFVGNGRAEKNHKLLKKKKIGAVLKLSPGKISPQNKKAFLTKHVPFSDSAHVNLSGKLASVLPFINKCLVSNCKIVVCCEKGLSRSPAVVAAYLIKYRGKTFEDTAELFEDKLPNIDINLGFMY